VLEYLESDATGIAEAVGRGEASAVQVVRAALERLAAVEPVLRAFRRVLAEQAMADAQAVDRAVARGERLPLAGVPIAVKAWDGLEAPQTVLLRRAGCVVIGLTSVPGPHTPWQTWGRTERGPTVNPWRADRTPGGSSAGSAVAVAARVVPLATGSDGAGSIRIPAAWCGVLGLKPTNGRVRGHDAAGLNVPGALVRTSRDAALHLSVLLGEEITPAGPEPLRAVWSGSLGFAQVDPEQAALARTAAERLHRAGRLVWRDHPVRLLDPGPAWHALRELGGDRENARRIRRANDDRLRAVFAEADVLLTPTTPLPPHGHDGPGETMPVDLTWGFNISGHPAISIPAGRAADGTPVGLQAIARHGREDVLLRLAADLERLSPWPVPVIADA